MRKIDNKAIFEQFTSSEKYLRRASEMYDEYFKQPASRKLIEQIYHELQRYAGTNVPDFDGYQSYIFTTYLSKLTDKTIVFPRFEYANPNRLVSEIIDGSVSEYEKSICVVNMLPLIYAHLANKSRQYSELGPTNDYLLDFNSLKLLHSLLSGDFSCVLAVFMEDIDSENLTYLDDDLSGLSITALVNRFCKAVKRRERSVCYKILGSAKDFDSGESDYLESVAHFYDQEYDKAIRFALKVKDGDTDHSSAVSLLLECYARLGDIHRLVDCILDNKDLKYPSLLLVYLYQETFLNSEEGNKLWLYTHDAEISKLIDYGNHSAAPGTMEDKYYIKLVKNTVDCVVKIYTECRNTFCYTADGNINLAGSKHCLAPQLLPDFPVFVPIKSLVRNIPEGVIPISEKWLGNFRQMAMRAIGIIAGTSSKVTINGQEFRSVELLLIGLESAYNLDLLTQFKYLLNRNIDTLITCYKYQKDERIADLILRAFTEESISGNLNEKIKDFVATGLKDWVDNRSLKQKLVAGKLSAKAKFAIESAEYLYQLSTTIDWGWKDAGMISLAYFRIIEVEINQKLILPTLNSLSMKQVIKLAKQAPQKQWGKILYKLKNVKKGCISGLMLGEMEIFFNNIGSKSVKGDCFAQSIKSSICKQLADVTNISSFISFMENDVLKDTIRDKYRNPPAHTRYLPYETALECREYFYFAMQQLQEFLK